MLEIKTSFGDSIPIITLSGRLDGYGATLLEQQLSAIESESPYWILDCDDVHFLSSAGIRILLKMEKQLRTDGGSLLLSAMKDEVINILSLTGLINQFSLVESVDDALQQARQHMRVRENVETLTCNKKTYILHHLDAPQCLIDIWSKSGISITDATKKQNLIPTNLSEFGIGFGIGGFGISAAQAEESPGLLFSMKNISGLSPADEHNLPDFIISNKPLEAPLFVAQCISFSGEPSCRIAGNKCESSLHSILDDLFKTIPKDITPVMMGFCILAQVKELRASKLTSSEDLTTQHYTSLDVEENALVFIQGVYFNRERITKDNEIKPLFDNLFLADLHENEYAIGCIAKGIDWEDITEINDAIRKMSNIDHLKDVVRVESESIIDSFNGWFFISDNIRSADEKRLIIEKAKDTAYNPEWDTIIRRIYSECNRVVLKQLHGGFTSVAFQVTSYDKEGRQLLPTVLKIGSIKNTENEVDAYHKYVEKFILNNSTTIMGTTRHKKWAGLRYNFVGINGTESTLCWLTDYYKKYPAEKLLPLFDRIFTDVLKPWYGQPRWEHIYPYSEHSPLTLFMNLFETLEKEQGISADAETIVIEDLKREIVNPYYFLKHEYPLRTGYSKLWYRGVNHGDLNMQNILLDEKENIYVIDFSETKPRNIVSDFARLEPIFKIEMCNLDSKEELVHMLEFEQGLLEVNHLDEKPSYVYHGNDPMVKKAYTLICRLREYADTVTLFERDIIPYIVALLEWTYPVICYAQLNDYKKRFAVYSAALMCEKILSLERSRREDV
ncbi:MAG TPA: STAS domain-containing protein [Candidatus Cloacimonetes bacterium]|nr:STAS domain-containing protein [Candidatus Cloacimonadota bacterium]